MTNNTLYRFVNLIESRSIENERSFNLLYSKRLYGNCLSILRQELDSFVRVIYLNNIGSNQERERLMSATLNGEKWKRLNQKMKMIPITDKEMVEFGDTLYGWTGSVYKFGCSFIHLSEYHDYLVDDPFNRLSRLEKQNIVAHINSYHMASLTVSATLQDIIPYLGNIYEKISSNISCEIIELKTKFGE